MPDIEKITDPARIEAAFERDQEAEDSRPAALHAPDAVSPAVQLAADHWPELLCLINEYAMALVDATNHQSASRADIAQSQAISALQKIRSLVERIAAGETAPAGLDGVEVSDSDFGAWLEAGGDRRRSGTL